MSSSSSAREDGAWADGVWVGGSVRESRPADGVRVFSVLEEERRHRVVVVEGSAVGALMAKVGKAHLAACSVDWRPITSFAEDRRKRSPNAFSCLYGNHVAAYLLEALGGSHGAGDEAREAMALGFGVNASTCEYRSNEGADALSLLRRWIGVPWRRAWVLALHADMPPDAFHSDGCERTPRLPGVDLFTVLAYPQAEAAWDDSWGGQLLIAPAICDREAEGRRDSERLFPSGARCICAAHLHALLACPLVSAHAAAARYASPAPE